MLTLTLIHTHMHTHTNTHMHAHIQTHTHTHTAMTLAVQSEVVLQACGLLSTSCLSMLDHTHPLSTFILFIFCFLLSTVVLSQGDFLQLEIWVAFHGKSQLRQIRTTQPMVHAGCFSVSIIHRTLTGTMGSLMCAHL